MREPTILDYALLTILALIWSSAFFNIKIATYSYGPVMIAFLRIFFGAIPVVGLCLIKKIKIEAFSKDWYWFALIGVVNLVIPFFLIAYGVQKVQSNLAAILMATTPLSATVLAHFFTQNEKINFTKFFGVLMGFSGIVFLFSDKFLINEENFISAVFILVGSTFYVIGGLLTLKISNKKNENVTSSILIWATIFILPISIILYYLNPTDAFVFIDDLHFSHRLDSTLSLIYNSLMSLSPWRKGPFSLFDITINAEWKSNLKWDRLKPVFPLLKNKRIIDIGCGNGYYMYRMLAHDPSFVMGVDPSDLTFFQFYAIQKYLEDKRLSYLPIGWQSLGCFDAYFDVVFCMGVLYHCKSPADLISMCRSVCKRDGVLVFETLIIDGDDDMALCPKDRYAKMPNVHFIPTVPCLLNWLKSGGFSSAEVISNEWTSTNEQRITEWTFPHSLSNCLDSENSRLTVEGYPAPKRVVVLATLK